MKNLVHLFISLVLFLFFYSCSENIDSKNELNDSLIVFYENESFDLNKKDQVDNLISNFVKNQVLQLKNIESVSATRKEFKKGHYILVSGVGYDFENIAIKFTIPFKENRNLKTGTVSTEFQACVMNCVANNCNECHQNIIDPCVEQTCSCRFGAGTCDPQIEFK